LSSEQSKNTDNIDAEGSSERPEKPRKKKFYIMISVLSALFIGAPAMAYLDVRYSYRDQIVYDIEQIEPVEYGIVFGAGVVGDRPSVVLQDRVEAAVQLYQKNKVQKLLMSGDGRENDYNEPRVMKQTALGLGVAEEDIVTDNAGLRTYDTCYRAKEVYGIGGAVLVTQDFHLERSLYTCNKLGIDSVGFVADARDYRSGPQFSLREIPASLVAFWEVNFIKPDVSKE
jgi:vancomycin permeability regulator SanA